VATIPSRGVPDVIVDLLKEFTNLVRSEVRLARAEVSAKITMAGMGLALIVCGAALAVAALVILLEAGVDALVNQAGFTPWQAAVILGVAALVVAVILSVIGAYRLKAQNLAPRKTVEQLQRDAAVAKYQVSPR
jgi:uncharacterized integral membrane protein